MISMIDVLEGKKDWEPFEINRNRLLHKRGNSYSIVGKALLKKGFDSKNRSRKHAYVSGGKTLVKRAIAKGKTK